MYKAARRGETVERKERHVTVNSFEVVRDEEDPQSVHFRVDCSKGTYVRTLAYDLVRKNGRDIVLFLFVSPLRGWKIKCTIERLASRIER